MIYLDHNATTPLSEQALDAMLPYLRESFGNPSAIYAAGRVAQEGMAQAREQVAGLLGCAARHVVFTSGGTESTNAAIRSALELSGKRHLVVSSVEHSATRNLAETLERQGIGVTYVQVDSDGQLDLDQLQRSIRADTALVSLMWANNETGVLFPVEEIGALCRERGVLFHVDAVQAVGKLPVALEALPIDYASVSAHKIYGPKGAGALYVNRRSGFVPLLVGGGQESGRRGGTENVPALVGFGAAAAQVSADTGRVRELRDEFEAELEQAFPDAVIHGVNSARLSNTSNFRLPGVEAESLLLQLDNAGICASAGSACTTGSLEPSHVLLAMGVKRADATSAVRFSFGRENTRGEVQQVMEELRQSVARLKDGLPPLTS
ncbi:MAG: cysteine desulfurase family protein [Verrucomicrobiota bacterium]